MDGIHKVTFPQNIGFINVSEYMEQFHAMEHDGMILFDLSETVSIHSSFIGFLIHAKHTIAKKSGKLTLLLSYTAEKILIMLNIIDFFNPEIIVSMEKKSA